MANVQTPHEKKPPVKNNNNNHDASSSNGAVNIYCVLCRRTYLKHEAQEHMHGMLHHRELETVLGKGSFHECQACNESSMGLNEYAQHISTAQHKANLKSLMSKNVKPFPLTKTLDPETIYQILERNKTLKKEQKKVMKKKRKKIVKKSKQVNTGILKHMQETHQGGSNTAVVQNKENKVSSLQQPTHQREATEQNQSERFPCVYGEPAGQTWRHPCFQDQFTPSSYKLRYDNFSVHNQCSKVTPESFQADSLVRGPYDTPIAWPAFSQHDHYNKQYDHAIDFTSDHLPQNGAIIFDHSNEIMRSSQPQQEGSHCSAQPASANTPANTAPIQDTDVSAMLWQIRRALGVREPCRADREARRQKSDTGVRLADQAGNEKKQPAGDCVRNDTKEAALPVTSAATTSVQSSLVGRPTPVCQPGVCPPNIAPAKPKQRVKTQKATQHCEKSPVVASHPKKPSNIRERESQGALHSQASLRTSSGRITSSESNVSRKVRIARETIRSSTLFSLSGAKRKLSWREMYEEMRRKKLEKGKGMPRFGIELVKTRSDQETSTQAEDLPLSEGFHWESLPDGPSCAHWTELPPPPRDSTDDDSHIETQSEIQMQEPLERPGAAQESRSSETIKAVSVKVEPNLEGENGDLRDHSSTKKRQYEVVTSDDISDKEQRGKRKKTKSSQDQNQMDQLLAVSLREDELSHSLQDLDESLIKARNILQVTYTEVQRLLLLRQQCTAEVNSLRARRIEILQGMKGGYSGASDVAEKATTSSAWATPAIQPRLSPLPSSSAFPASSTQQPPPTNPTSSISQPNPAPFVLPTMPAMREICQPPPVSCNPDTPQVPLNQPLFPSDLLPPLLLSSPCVVASTTAVTSPKQLKTKCCTSANPSPELPARQPEPVTKKGLKDCVKTGRLVRDEVDSDSKEETGGHLRAAAEKPGSILLPEKNHNASAAALDNEGENESDDSVKMTEPSNLVVIDADESDKEETTSNVPVHPEPPQKSVSVEFSSVSVQTCQKNNVDRKVQPTLVPVKDASVSPKCTEGIEDEEPSLGAFVNHTGPVLGLQVHEGLLYTCSADNTTRAYSLKTKECQAVFKGHTSKVNCLLVSSLPNMPARVFTGSSDQTIRCYSIKSQKCLEQISLSDRVLCLHIAWNILFAGLANGSVACYELKTLKQLDVLDCHGPRGVSCLGTAQEGARRVLLVGSYDSTISVRDARSGLLLRSLEGHTKTVLCMKVVNDLVFSGSSDTSVHAHNIHTGELVRIYKGHGHAVTSIVILGKVMVTACLDKLVRVYELQSHDRLQVYGGHSDMVMCMAVHKSVIYTGCYDGSIQAVKLNLLKNYRCWWQNCSLIFGMAEHLAQHLVKDHTNPNQDWVKCRWRGCSFFFAHQQSVRQKLPEHMQSHAEKDSEVQP